MVENLRVAQHLGATPRLDIQQRVDLQVRAVATEDRRGDHGTRPTVLIEVKGDWNAEVETALRTQLVDRYLRGKGLRCGLYVVFWFAGEGSDAEERAQREALEQTLDAQARALRGEGMNVLVRVIDATWR